MVTKLHDIKLKFDPSVCDYQHVAASSKLKLVLYMAPQMKAKQVYQECQSSICFVHQSSFFLVSRIPSRSQQLILVV